MSETLCNIGYSERRKRLIVGVLFLLLGMVLGIVMIAAGGDRWWRLALIPIVYPGIMGLLQAREAT